MLKIFTNRQKKLLKFKTAGPPSTFLKNGTLIKKPIELATIQLEYFSEKIDKLMNRLANQPQTLRNPLEYLELALQRWENKQKVPKFKFREVTTQETIKMIAKLGNSTACGLDELDAHSIKLAADSLILPIKHLVNTSLVQARYANHWKISKTIPILKDKSLDKTSPSSYRPIALLSTISKVVERAAQTQLLAHFENSGQFNPNSHGYRQELSTTTTLIQLMDGLYTAADNKKISSLMATDQSSAFDCVRHTLLIKN